ncbi:hypothetical protein DPMN_104132 [Dreissena polymorpha]|uniref:Uncharacterized protein n=1 Tax=Dreissena polymorpha TaxID=45954 RepID=A0A9D4HCF0_DREPO|nr:hypothetical protein DPMN_104132 [Dreissena polymorpha]
MTKYSINGIMERLTVGLQERTEDIPLVPRLLCGIELMEMPTCILILVAIE